MKRNRQWYVVNMGIDATPGKRLRDRTRSGGGGMEFVESLRSLYSSLMITNILPLANHSGHTIPRVLATQGTLPKAQRNERKR
jgi:hypothetical protein